MPDIVQPLKRFGIGSNKNEIYWEGLAECYKRGLVKNVGVCNYGPTLLSQCQEALAKHNVPLASNQIAYSLIGRHNGAQETVDKCNELGIKVLAYYPFAMVRTVYVVHKVTFVTLYVHHLCSHSSRCILQIGLTDWKIF
jgi:pyridoxine 4-dehydrogenase